MTEMHFQAALVAHGRGRLDTNVRTFDGVPS